MTLSDRPRTSDLNRAHKMTMTFQWAALGPSYVLLPLMSALGRFCPVSSSQQEKRLNSYVPAPGKQRPAASPEALKPRVRAGESGCAPPTAALRPRLLAGAQSSVDTLLPGKQAGARRRHSAYTFYPSYLCKQVISSFTFSLRGISVNSPWCLSGTKPSSPAYRALTRKA